MIVDFRNNVIKYRDVELKSAKKTHKRAMKFLAVLIEFSRNEDRNVYNNKLYDTICETNRGVRTIVCRVIDYITDNLDSNIIDYKNKTTGPWCLKKQITDCKIIYSNERTEISDTVVGDGNRSNLIDTAGIRLSDLKKLVNADFYFSRGDLNSAHELYSNVYKGHHNESYDLILLKLLKSSRRLERYPELLKTIRLVEGLENIKTDRKAAEKLHSYAQISRAWYNYSFDKEYDNAYKILKSCMNASFNNYDTQLEWKNLYSLVVRRLSLSNAGSKKEELALESISEMESAFSDSIMFGSPYNVQQTAANLGNLISLFGSTKHGILDTSLARTRAITYFDISAYVSKNYGIGLDDVYLPVYILSHCRKFSVNSSELKNLVRDWDKTLKEYAIDAYDLYMRSGRGRPEQKVQIIIEILHQCFVDEDWRSLEKYTEEIHGIWWELSPDTAKPYEDFIAGMLKALESEFAGSANFKRVGNALRALAS
ncbi:hypothetical protein L5876_10930 [Hyphobacterium sp. SN044]|uniref:hypothetical protein n=1 Tax=Hyphobacterium sp. SN044 TaxID=2912575 RepID=UPI001F321037|nr:hypothetical protein [Hyphobacterium sp. SN044]MCF8880330.1 hypothetical protein [Hyphobacterium sp. SN044]